MVLKSDRNIQEKLIKGKSPGRIRLMRSCHMLPNALRIFCAKHLLRGLTAQHEVVFDISNPDYIQENLCLFSFKLVQKGVDQPASLDLSKTMIDVSRII